MTQAEYEELTSKLLGMFNTLNDTDLDNAELNKLVKKANAMVALSKVCLQTEVLKRATNNMRSRLNNNISRLALDTPDGGQDESTNTTDEE